MYAKSLKSGRRFIIARICKMFSGKYGFETKLILSDNKKAWELNMNMPLFELENEARSWIEKQAQWRTA